MKHIAAYLLATLGGNTAPTVGDVEKILGSVGVDADADKLAALMKELEGKDLAKVMEAGASKLAAMPAGGAAGPAAAAGGAEEAAPEAEPEPEEEEEEEESDDDMGFGLFD